MWRKFVQCTVFVFRCVQSRNTLFTRSPSPKHSGSQRLWFRLCKYIYYTIGLGDRGGHYYGKRAPDMCAWVSNSRHLCYGTSKRQRRTIRRTGSDQQTGVCLYGRTCTPVQLCAYRYSCRHHHWLAINFVLRSAPPNYNSHPYYMRRLHNHIKLVHPDPVTFAKKFNQKH